MSISGGFGAAVASLLVPDLRFDVGRHMPLDQSTFPNSLGEGFRRVRCELRLGTEINCLGLR
jgi:hypothetical protein